MLRRSLSLFVPYVTECHALYHGAFYPTVALPMEGPRPAVGGPLSAKDSCVKASAAAAAVTAANIAAAAGGGGDAAAASLPAVPKRKHTLVLDIDETLIHTFRNTGGDIPAMGLGKDKQPKGFEDVADLVSIFENGKGTGIDNFLNSSSYFKFWTRPYLQEFLEEVTELFEVVFWTAGTAPYMAAIINGLERQVLHKMLAGTDNAAASGTPDIKMIADNTSYVYDFKKNITDISAPNQTVGDLIGAYQKSHPAMNYYGFSRCQTLGQNYLKHLPLLGRENTDNVILMDDATRSFVFTPRSAILVDQFKTKNDNDTFLRDVMPMLRAVAKADVAAVELDHWRDDAYTSLDDLDANTKKFLMACPSEVAKQKEIQIGAFLKERRSDGPIAPAKLFGAEYEEKMKPGIEGEVERIQGDYSATASGLLHLFVRKPTADGAQ